MNVAFNGFNILAMEIFKQIADTDGWDVVAINVITPSPSVLAEQLKYSTVYGPWYRGTTLAEISGDDDNSTLTLNGKAITVYKEANAENCPWGQLGVDVVFECSGFYNTAAKAEAHINAGARKVIICESTGADVKTVVYGVNQSTVTASDLIVSSGDGAIQAASILCNALNVAYPVKFVKADVYSANIQPNPNQNNLVFDGTARQGLVSTGRSASYNITPLSGDYMRAVAMFVVTDLTNKCTGRKYRVPVRGGLLVQLTFELESSGVTADEIYQAFHGQTDAYFRESDGALVSSDITVPDKTQGGDVTFLKGSIRINAATGLGTVSALFDDTKGLAGQIVRTAQYIDTI